MTKEEFKILIANLCDEFETKMTDEKIRRWWEHFKKFSYQEVYFAFNECITRCTFFPRLAEIFQYLRRDEDFKIAANEAWANLQFYLRNSSAGEDEITQRVVKMLGGARALAMQNETQLQFTANRFIDLYQTIAKEDSKEKNKISYENIPVVVKEISSKMKLVK